MKIGLFILLIPLTVIGCIDKVDQRVDLVTKSFTEEISEEAYVIVEKIDFDSLYIVRIFSTLMFDEADMPNRIHEINNHYIFEFNDSPDKVSLREVPEEIILKEKLREIIPNYNPPFWLTIICNNGEDFKTIRNPHWNVHPPITKEEAMLPEYQYWWHQPLDSVKSISSITDLEFLGDFVCD